MSTQFCLPAQLLGPLPSHLRDPHPDHSHRQRRSRTWRVLAAVVLGTLLTACGGGNDNPAPAPVSGQVASGTDSPATPSGGDTTPAGGTTTPAGGSTTPAGGTTTPTGGTTTPAVAAPAITQQPANGSLVINGDGTVTYTQDGAAAASDSFQYTIKDASGTVTQFGYEVPNQNFFVQPWFFSNGTGVLKDDWSGSNMLDPKVAESLQFLHDLIHVDGVSPIPGKDTMDNQFTAGQVAMISRGHWIVQGAKRMLQGLAAYVRALDPAACPARTRQPLDVGLLMADARRAMRAAEAEAAAGDPATAVVMVASARSRLGLIDERYAAPSLAKARAALRGADQRLAEAQAALRERRPEAPQVLKAWLARSAPLEAELDAARKTSLFNPALLSQAVKRRLPG